MREHLRDQFESLYRDHVDPWSYRTSAYEQSKYREQIALVAQFVEPRQILEIACSVGAQTKLIHECFPEAIITAIDISPTAVARAAADVAALGVVTFHAADIFTFADTLPPRSLDAIFWSETFDYLHEHCTFAEFSRLVRTLNGALTSDGVLCVSHIVPNPLAYRPIDAASKNVRAFHDLILDYFTPALTARNTLWKMEDDQSYRYEITLYRPRLLEQPLRSGEAVQIDRIDIIIPARDEADTVGQVVAAVRQSGRVNRVIVIDNGSVDGTATAAAAAGAKVVSCEERGYGRAVKRGILECERPWVLKLDADIENFKTEWIDILIDHALREQSRLVKTCWPPSIEDPERVTNFTVKPALRIFFPELLFLHTPISGIYLFDRSQFDFSQMPNNFSFDLALLIAALKRGLAISEVEIESIRHGTIANGKRTYQYYFNMADELLRFLVGAGLERFQ